jgi:probable HAF family extracellular repeat protein
VPVLFGSGGGAALPNTFGYGFLYASGVNRGGTAVGTGAGGRGAQRALVWRNGAAEELPQEDGDADETEFLFGSRAVAINDGGTIVGQAETQYGVQGVVWDGDDVRLLMSLNPTDEYQSSSAHAINASGQIAGYADLGSVGKAVVWETGGVRVLDGLFGRSSASDINDLGVAVGWTETADGRAVAFRNDGATTTLLPTLTGMAYADAAGINSAGLIVGYSAPEGTAEGVATLWKNGTAYDLNTLLGLSDWNLISATGIDDDGTIIGFGRYRGDYASFRITPVPEPATIAALGLGALAMVRRKRRLK